MAEREVDPPRRGPLNLPVDFPVHTDPIFLCAGNLTRLQIDLRNAPIRPQDCWVHTDRLDGRYTGRESIATSSPNSTLSSLPFRIAGGEF